MPFQCVRLSFLLSTLLTHTLMSDSYSGPSQTPEIELFVKAIEKAKVSILDV